MKKKDTKSGREMKAESTERHGKTRFHGGRVQPPIKVGGELYTGTGRKIQIS